jgi:hypothetical protein
VDSDELVEFQIDAGQRLVVQLVRDGFEVKAAFWAKTAEEGIWFLYIATPLVEQRGSAEAYRLLQASLQRLEGIPLSLADVKVIGAENPVTRDVLNILNRYPAPLATRYGGKQLAKMTVEGAYLYPERLYAAQEARAMTPQEVAQKVLGLMNRTGTLESSRVTLTNGTTFLGVPVGLELLNNVMNIKFIIDNVHSPQNYPITEIAEIS